MDTDQQALSASPARVLMLGKGWFPAQLGGLNRYYRALLEQLPEARGIVVGPAEDADNRVTLVSRHSAHLAARLLAYAHVANREAVNADVIDAHFALYSVLPLVVGRIRHKPLMVHFHGPWADENVTAGDASRLHCYIRGRLERAVYSRAQVIISLSGAFRRILVERYHISPWKTLVLGPGVDVEQFAIGDRSAARERFGLEAGAFVVCCVRRLVPRMGLGVLIDAWAQFAANDPSARLLLAGEGELSTNLRRQIDARSLQTSVRLLGRISDDDLRNLYRAADVNVVPSVAFEGFGLVVLEAAACGTPSVVSCVGGLPEAVAAFGPDLIVPPCDAHALRQRLESAAEGNLPAREHIRAHAESHQWQVVAQAHREVIRSVSSGEQATRPHLRVVYLDHVAQLSGGELALVRLVNALTDVHAHVILAEDGPLVMQLLRAGISVEVLPMPSRARQIRRNSMDLRQLPSLATAATLFYSLMLARRLRQLRPDVVHTNSLKAGIYGSLAARVAGVPVVWHLRDRLDTDYLPKAGVWVARAWARHIPDVVISNSRATNETLGRRERSVVVPSAVGLTTPRADHSLRKGMLVVGMIGRLAPWKGQDVFLKAFARAFPEGTQRAVIVGAPLFGEHEIEYAQRLYRLAEDLGIAERVQFRGHRQDIATELRSMDVLVHASVIPEPFGQVVLEGMSAELAVVATRDGGPAEIITNDVDGLLYPRGDVVALAQILTILDAQPKLRTRLGQAGRRRAQDFSPTAAAQNTMLAYELARAHRPSRRRTARTGSRLT